MSNPHTELKNVFREFLERRRESGITGKTEVRNAIERIYKENGVSANYAPRDWGFSFFGEIAVVVEFTSRGAVKSFDVT